MMGIKKLPGLLALEVEDFYQHFTAGISGI